MHVCVCRTKVDMYTNTEIFDIYLITRLRIFTCLLTYYSLSFPIRLYIVYKQLFVMPTFQHCWCCLVLLLKMTDRMIDDVTHVRGIKLHAHARTHTRTNAYTFFNSFLSLNIWVSKQHVRRRIMFELLILSWYKLDYHED